MIKYKRDLINYVVVLTEPWYQHDHIMQRKEGKLCKVK